MTTDTTFDPSSNERTGDFDDTYATAFRNAIASVQGTLDAMTAAADSGFGRDDETYVYVASSWRNPHQPAVVEQLRAAGVGVYDFRNPEGGTGFAWSSIDPDWESWTADEYATALEHPLAEAGYRSDMDAMERADTFVLVLPCGRSAHLELGWAAGMGKRTAILTRDGEEPELMAKMVDLITDDPAAIEAWVVAR